MKYFIFKDTTRDTQEAIIDLESIAAAQVDLEDYTITLGFYHAPSIVVDFHTDTNASSEFLRLTTEMMSFADLVEQQEGIFVQTMFGGQLDD